MPLMEAAPWMARCAAGLVSLVVILAEVGPRCSGGSATSSIVPPVWTGLISGSPTHRAYVGSSKPSQKTAPACRSTHDDGRGPASGGPASRAQLRIDRSSANVGSTHASTHAPARHVV